MLNSAKFEVALAEFWKTWRLSALSVQCWPSLQRMMGISNCALYGRLTERRMLTACETDTLGAVAMLTNYQAALGETLPHFIDWTIQHRENPNWLLAWHCGNAVSLAASEGGSVALPPRHAGRAAVNERDPMAGLFHSRSSRGRSPSAAAEYDTPGRAHRHREIIPSDETCRHVSWVQVAITPTLPYVVRRVIPPRSMIHGDQNGRLLERASSSTSAGRRVLGGGEHV